MANSEREYLYLFGHLPNERPVLVSDVAFDHLRWFFRQHWSLILLLAPAWMVVLLTIHYHGEEVLK